MELIINNPKSDTLISITTTIKSLPSLHGPVSAEIIADSACPFTKYSHTRER